jgi:hypothetical protein
MAKKRDIDKWIRNGQKVWEVTNNGPIEVELLYRDYMYTMVQYVNGHRGSCPHWAICETREEALDASIVFFRNKCMDELLRLDKQFVRLKELINESRKYSHLVLVKDKSLLFFKKGFRLMKFKKGE